MTLLILKSFLILATSVVGGGLLTFAWSDWLHERYRFAHPLVPGAAPELRLTWIPALVGILERSLFTVMIAWSVEGSGAFCGGWVTAKAITGMGPWNANTTQQRDRVGIGFLGSGLSLLVGVICGLVLKAWLAA